MQKNEEMLRKIKEDADFINSPKYRNSLNEFMQQNDDGVENDYIAKVLLLTEEEVEQIHQEAIEMLKDYMGEEKGE